MSDPKKPNEKPKTELIPVPEGTAASPGVTEIVKRMIAAGWSEGQAYAYISNLTTEQLIRLATAFDVDPLSLGLPEVLDSVTGAGDGGDGFDSFLSQSPIDEALGRTGAVTQIQEILSQTGLNRAQAQAILAGIGFTQEEIAQGWARLDLDRQVQIGNLGVAESQVGINAAAQRATEAYQQGLIALQMGNLDLARQQFGHAQDMDRRRQLLEEQAFELGANVSNANIALDAYNALQQNNVQRAGLGISGLGTASGIVGQLLGQQGELDMEAQRLGLDILSTPRNAIAGALLSRGSNITDATGAQRTFNPQVLAPDLGVDSGMLQGLLSQLGGMSSSLLDQSFSPPGSDIIESLIGRFADPYELEPPPLVQSNVGRDYLGPNTTRRATSGTETTTYTTPGRYDIATQNGLMGVVDKTTGQFIPNP